MIQKVLLPRLGETMDSAEITAWRVAEGDHVDKGDVLLEITTDKATLEVESYVRGTVRRILARPGEVIAVNGVIALVGDPNDPLPDLESATQAGQETPPEDGVRRPDANTSEALLTVGPTGRARCGVSPRARRAARQLGVPLDQVTGTGPGGRIIERDILAWAAQAPAARAPLTQAPAPGAPFTQAPAPGAGELPAPDTRPAAASPLARRLARDRGLDLADIAGSGPRGRVMSADLAWAEKPPPHGQPLSPMRRLIAERMSASKREIPHFYLMADVDMTAAVAYRAVRNEQASVKVTFNDLLLRAAALAAREVPAALTRWTDDGLLPLQRIDIGLAVALDEGLIVPVVREVDRLSLAEVARASAELVDKARSKRLLPEATEGGCLTITNLGMFGVDAFLPIIVPGQSAILGVGRIKPTVAVVNDAIAIRQVTRLALAVDHRAVDGAMAARFLAALKARMEAPGDLDAGAKP